MPDFHYATLGFSHHKTPIELREKLAFDGEMEVGGFLRTLLRESNGLIPEALLISTCNRTEFFFITAEFDAACDCILEALSKSKKIETSKLKEVSQAYYSTDAIHHIFSVASSLDSVVVGETQIAGQLKDAYRFAHENGFCAKEMTRIVHFAFKTAARVRNQTQISSNAISVASIAAQKAKALQEEHGLKPHALVVGFGQMGSLAVKHLLSDGFKVCVLSRDIEKIKIESENLSINYFNQLDKVLGDYPIVISATGAFEAVINDDLLTQFKKEGKRFYFDLALPRDIEIDKERARELDISIFRVDDLKQVSEQNLSERQESLKKAYQIVGIATMEFVQWIQTLGVEPLIKSIREMAKNASLKEIERAIKKGYLPKELQFSVEKILHQAFNVFLHKPTQILRNHSTRQESDIIIESIKTFFGIDESVFINAYQCEYEKKEK